MVLKINSLPRCFPPLRRLQKTPHHPSRLHQDLLASSQTRLIFRSCSSLSYANEYTQYSRTEYRKLTSSTDLIPSLRNTSYQLSFSSDLCILTQNASVQLRSIQQTQRLARERENIGLVTNLPIRDDTMIQQHTPNDLRHLTDNTVFTNDRFFDIRPFVDFCRGTDHGIGGDLGFLVD